MKTVLITGATGLVGQKLCIKLVADGYTLKVLTRNIKRAEEKVKVPCTFYEWDTASLPPKESIQGTDIVINLMGENIAQKRWSKLQRAEIHRSRVQGTKFLVEGLNKFLERDLDLFISTSAIGYYKSNTNIRLDELSEKADSFLSKVCQDWEKEASLLRKSKRNLITRLGVVLDINGGMIKKLSPIYKLALGGPIGFGHRIISWIHIDDLVNIYLMAIKNEKYEGVVNATAPYPTSSTEFSHAMARAIGLPDLFPVPPVILKIVFGELSCLMLDSVEVYPRKLEKLGHRYIFSEIGQAINQIFKKN
ncbi:TIGR01777 family protein [Halobacteriovorax marinus]|uniref:TIGR01777 family protein n=1 Tax=Halobacteriovorax marinus TaxID=97084 RepID=A0A1Y5F9I5_9BACT|nr:TIGR01777 family protein [Halobacteriovorax marinus]